MKKVDIVYTDGSEDIGVECDGVGIDGFLLTLAMSETRTRVIPWEGVRSVDIDDPDRAGEEEGLSLASVTDIDEIKH